MLEGRDIVLFPVDKETQIQIHADVDISIPISIVSTGALSYLKVDYEPCHDSQVKDAKHRVHVPVGKINLNWHKTSIAIQDLETFYVVESDTAMVVLGKSAFPNGDKGNDGVFPIGLAQQTPEAKAQQEQRKEDAERRRAEEKKQQEDREREKRQGQGGK
ncbi:MAG: hypothetical protein Q9201_003922 [Fulgogasparrea decipioides]